MKKIDRPRICEHEETGIRKNECTNCLGTKIKDIDLTQGRETVTYCECTKHKVRKIVENEEKNNTQYNYVIRRALSVGFTDAQADFLYDILAKKKRNLTK